MNSKDFDADVQPDLNLYWAHSSLVCSFMTWLIYRNIDWLQSLKQIYINMSYNIHEASLTLMALFFLNRATRVRLATSILYDVLMKNV